MGSPKFSLETLDILNKNENINLSLVVSGKDKKRNRNKFKPTVVKQYALDNNIEVVTPDSVNTDEFINLLKEKKYWLYSSSCFWSVDKRKIIRRI